MTLHRPLLAAAAILLAARAAAGQAPDAAVREDMQRQAEQLREQAQLMRDDALFQADKEKLKAETKAHLEADLAGQAERIRELTEHWRDEVLVDKEALKADIDASVRAGVLASVKAATGAALQLGLDGALLAQAKIMTGRHSSSDRQYDRGRRALDGRRWDEAVEAFTQAAGSTDHADGALYWKAYALNKLGRRDDALSAIAELRKTHPSSRWLDDAKALELEVRQASGQNVAPESESDEELKLIALNGLIESDPDRALPILEKLLKSSQTPRLKERALFVLAQNDSPRSRQTLEQVARGGAGNPDLQLKAISFLGARKSSTDNRALLTEIYSSSADANVKRAVLHAMVSRRDKDGLLQLVRNEKSQPLRLEGISMLGATGAQADLLQLYQSESSAEVKERILQSMGGSQNALQLLEVARAEKDPKLRRAAIRSLGGSRTPQTADALVSMYTADTDPLVKGAIIDALTRRENARQLVDLARKEPDAQRKREIVSRLSGMKTKEASDYLLELLK